MPVPTPPAPQGPAGTLDPSFGTGGIVLTQVGDHGGSAGAVMLQPDDKIVAAGSASVGNSAGRSLVRYNADGSLDPAFGSGGKVVVLDVGGATGATLQPDGKIVTVGTWGSSGPAGYCMLARFRSDGSLDPNFGNGDVVAAQLANPDSTPVLNTYCGGVALQPDGKSVVAAAGQPIHGGTIGLGAMRFNADGTRDTSFGAGGSIVVPMTYPYIRTTSVALQPDGKIIVVGGDIDSTPGLQVRNNETMLMRLDPTGMLDASFGQGGTVRILRNEGAFLAIPAIALQPDGKIVLLGVWGQVLRLLPNGALDSNFGQGGAAHDIYGFTVAVQANGKIVIAGFSPPTNGAGNFALWRLTAEGLPDAGFGNGGSVTTPIGINSQAGSVAIQRDGRIVVGGSTVPSLDAVVARYFGDPVATSPP